MCDTVRKEICVFNKLVIPVSVFGHFRKFGNRVLMSWAVEDL